MTLYFLILMGLIAVGEAVGLVLQRITIAEWQAKYADAIRDLLPWDYTREGGWRE